MKKQHTGYGGSISKMSQKPRQGKLPGIFQDDPRLLAMGDVVFGFATSYKQVRLPIEGLGQLSHKTLNPQYLLATRCTWVKDGTEFEGRTN